MKKNLIPLFLGGFLGLALPACITLFTGYKSAAWLIPIGALLGVTMGILYSYGYVKKFYLRIKTNSMLVLKNIKSGYAKSSSTIINVILVIIIITNKALRRLEMFKDERPVLSDRQIKVRAMKATRKTEKLLFSLFHILVGICIAWIPFLFGFARTPEKVLSDFIFTSFEKNIITEYLSGAILVINTIGLMLIGIMIPIIVHLESKKEKLTLRRMMSKNILGYVAIGAMILVIIYMFTYIIALYVFPLILSGVIVLFSLLIISIPVSIAIAAVAYSIRFIAKHDFVLEVISSIISACFVYNYVSNQLNEMLTILVLSTVSGIISIGVFHLMFMPLKKWFSGITTFLVKKANTYISIESDATPIMDYVFHTCGGFLLKIGSIIMSDPFENILFPVIHKSQDMMYQKFFK